MSMCASASATAAPPMSFFISAMPALGLISRPPLSKHTPLPTRAMRGSFAGAGRRPANLDQPRRIRARAPDGMNGGKIRGAQLLAHPFPEARLVALGQRTGGRRELARPEIAKRAY